LFESFEIVEVESKEIWDAMNQHRSYEPGVVNFNANYGMSRYEPAPF
jgi:hypothetical protein